MHAKREGQISRERYYERDRARGVARERETETEAENHNPFFRCCRERGGMQICFRNSHPRSAAVGMLEWYVCRVCTTVHVLYASAETERGKEQETGSKLTACCVGYEDIMMLHLYVCVSVS